MGRDRPTGQTVSAEAPGRAGRIGGALLDPVPVVLSLLAVCSIAAAWRDVDQRSSGLDFYVNWVVPQAVRQGMYQNVYSAEVAIRQSYLRRAIENNAPPRHQAAAAREALDIVGTPFLYATFALFAGEDYERDFHLYLACCLAAFVLSVFLLCRLLGYSPAAVLAVVTLCYFLEPFRSELRVLNVNILQLTMLAVFLYLQSKQHRAICTFAAGAVLGLAVMFKPTLALVPLLLLATWLINRRLKTLGWAGGGMASGAGMAFVIGGLFFGTPRCWLDFMGRLRLLLAEPFGTSIGNFGLANLIREATGLDLSPLLLGALVLAALVVIWLVRAPVEAGGSSDESAADRGRALHADFLAVALSCAIALAWSSLAWAHYFLLLLPLALYVLRPDEGLGATRNRARLVRRSAAVVGLLLISNCSMAFDSLAGPYSAAVLYNAAVIIFLSLGLWEIHALGRRRAGLG